MSSLLEVKNLHKVYNNDKEKIHVLRGINLKIEKGEFFSILGPSGAGKSTFLHLLGGLDRPTEGEIIFEGENLNNLTDSQISSIRNRRMSFVFQFYHLLSEFNVLENVILPAIIKSKISVCSVDKKNQKSKTKERAEGLLEIVGLKDRMYHYPAELSGGERQRTAIVRALINSPDIIFCDEPTGNLDSENSFKFLNLLKKLNEDKNITVLIVTHNSDVANFAKKILYMHDGMIYDKMTNEL